MRACDLLPTDKTLETAFSLQIFLEADKIQLVRHFMEADLHLREAVLHLTQADLLPPQADLLPPQADLHLTEAKNGRELFSATATK